MSEKKSVKKAATKSNNGKKTMHKDVLKLSPKQNKDKKMVKIQARPGIKKQYPKTGGTCNVTFVLPKDAAPDAQIVTVVGDFNNWSLMETPMKKQKNGDFRVTLKLTPGVEYRFRYFIDSNRWENDWCADRYVPNAYGCDDSIVIV